MLCIRQRQLGHLFAFGKSNPQKPLSDTMESHERVSLNVWKKCLKYEGYERASQYGCDAKALEARASRETSRNTEADTN